MKETSPETTVADLGERVLIERIRARVPPPPDWVEIGIGDDAAVIAPDRNAFDVVTTDALVEGVHFDRAFVPPRAIGHRALAANLSDLAAMGARPRAALLSLALPDRLPVADFDQILDGLLSLAAAERVALVGGNIARSSGPLVVDLTAIGSAQRRRVLRRAGARPGDVLFVSGPVGGAAAGLEWCRRHGLPAAGAIEPGGPAATSGRGSAVSTADRGSAFPSPEPVSDLSSPDPASSLSSWDPAAPRPGSGQAPRPGSAGLPGDAGDPMHGAARRFLYPDPRVRLGWVLARNHAASACVDLSDGLADAVHQLATAGGVGAIVDGRAVPIDAGCREWFSRAGVDPLLAALTGGEDYELLFTLPARHQRLLQAISRQAAGRGAGRGHGLHIARVGVVTRDPRVVLRRDGGDEPLPRGFAHFR